MGILFWFLIRIALLAAGPSVFNGEEWVSIDESLANALPAEYRAQTWKSNYLAQDIFVGIVSYRDNRCGESVKRLFSKSSHPERIHVGILQYRSQEDAECLVDYCKTYGTTDVKSNKCLYISQISIITASQFEMKSFSHARHLLDTLRQNEEFCMSTEVNIDVINSWDEKMLSMWNEIDNEYGVLSTYPFIASAATVEENVNNNIDLIVKYSTTHENEVPHLCQANYIGSDGTNINIDQEQQRPQQMQNQNRSPHTIIQAMSPRPARQLTKPLLTTQYSSAYSFNKCHLNKKVQWDPNYHNIHKGDDFVYYMRLWTTGYDAYTPHQVVISIDETNTPIYVGGSGNSKESFDKYKWVTKNGMSVDVRNKNREQSALRMNTLMGSRYIYWNSKSNAYDALPHAEVELLGLTKYGLGLVRSIDQFIAFTGIDTRNKVIVDNKCKTVEWVPPCATSSSTKDAGVDTADKLWGNGPELLYAVAGSSSVQEPILVNSNIPPIRD